MPDLQGAVLGFTVSIYKPVLLKSVATIVVDRNYFYRSTQPTYYQMSTRASNLGYFNVSYYIAHRSRFHTRHLL